MLAAVGAAAEAGLARWGDRVVLVPSTACRQRAPTQLERCGHGAAGGVAAAAGEPPARHGRGERTPQGAAAQPQRHTAAARGDGLPWLPGGAAAEQLSGPALLAEAHGRSPAGDAALPGAGRSRLDPGPELGAPSRAALPDGAAVATAAAGAGGQQQGGPASDPHLAAAGGAGGGSGAG